MSGKMDNTPSFIEDYFLSVENTKPCHAFHTWSMLYAMSVFAGRRFWFPFGRFNYYTNLYVVLVGPPSAGKSSAMNPAKAIVRASGVCPIAASQITKEALMLKMSSTVDGKPKKVPYEGQKFFEWGGKRHEYNQYAIFATELTQFIGVNPLGFIEFFTAAWDEPVIEVETKGKGHDFVVGPYITLLACMTPDIVKGYLKMNVLSSGFARRTAFVHDTGKNIVPWPTNTPEQQAAILRLVEFGKNLQNRSGAFSISPECAEFYEAWNLENEQTLLNKPPTTQGWYDSKGEMLFKLSMLIALATNCKELVIEVPHYKLALQFCAMLEKNLERVFEGIGINPNAQVALQMCRMLEHMPTPMNKKHVEAMFFEHASSLNELRDTIAHLVNVGKLQERQIMANGTLVGTLIGTPASMQGRSDVELASFLSLRVAPQPASETGSSPEAHPQPAPERQPEG